MPVGAEATIGGRQIAGGMIYFGSDLRALHGQGPEPALIDPRLPVDWNYPDWQGAGLDYWPSYGTLSPQSRAAYLSWLASGRSDPLTPIGYVFLFFYGLERRFIADVGMDGDAAEVAALASEIRRLLGIYGENHSFQRYATGLLDLLGAGEALGMDLTPPDYATIGRGWEVPTLVRVGVGRYVAAGEAIPADWALVLLRTHPEAYLRTPATRCAAEFDDLFRIRYGQRFGDGMKVRPPKATVQLGYYPASGGMRGTVTADLGAIPDITQIKGPITKLRDLASECTNELDAYSRLIGRRPETQGTPASAGLLPEDLLDAHGGPAISDLRTWVAATVASGPRAADLDSLVQRWAPGRTEKLAKADAVSLAGLLGKLGAGMEPDVRFGAATPRPGSRVVLFAQEADAPTAPSQGYAAAATLVHLTAVVAASDGSVTAEERAEIAQHLERTLDLDTHERARLEAHLQWLVSGKPALSGLKKRIDELGAPERTAIGHFLVDIAAADGQVTPHEITTLTKVYKLLGLDESEVYSTVHALGSGDRGPVMVRPAEPETRWSIPPPAPGAPGGGIQLDRAKVEARVAETATVAALLASIFTDDEAAVGGAIEENHPEPSPQAPASVSLPGLDPQHSELASRLRARSSWERAEVEHLAADLGLPLLDGALDRVNEAAMDACGEPLVDGDEELKINDYAVEELFA